MRTGVAQAARLSGCSHAQLNAWARSGLVEPDEEGAYGFRELVALRVVRSLLDAGLSLPKVKRSIRYLRESGDDIAGLRLVTDGEQVWACHDDGQILDALRHGQLALFVSIDHFVGEVEAEIAAFNAERDAFMAGLEPGGDAATAS
jgi:DNA-binding transcriptional MerR regulator